MSQDIISFEVSLPTDEGFVGRSCNDPDCRRYFKVNVDSLKDRMFCPYCGTQFSNDELWTTDQLEYLQKATLEKAREAIFAEVDRMFGKLARRTSRNKYVKITHKPIHYRARTVLPGYTEQQVDSELKCPECGFIFQVFGIFGYCPGCRSENLLIYDANLAIIRQEISTSSDPDRALRHAYSDIVSTFEFFCSTKAALITRETTRFQRLFDSRRFFKRVSGVDIFEELSDSDLLVLRRVFEKRHVYEHNRGIISERYARMIPEDSHLVGQEAELSLDELISAARLLRQVLDSLIQAIQRQNSI